MAARPEKVDFDVIPGDGIGVNELLRESYSIMRNVVQGSITPAVGSAAARNCGNVLKGLELRAKYGASTLRF